MQKKPKKQKNLVCTPNPIRANSTSTEQRQLSINRFITQSSGLHVLPLCPQMTQQGKRFTSLRD